MSIKSLKHKIDYRLLIYGLVNFFAIYAVNRLSDLPVLLGNWEAKALALSQFKFPGDNFYPPGSSILLVPFLWARPHYELVVYFYFVISSLIYFSICNRVILNRKYKAIALAALTLNPYLLWTCNSGQDTVFELFLLLSFAALLLKGREGGALFPLYLLCLVRPAYWTLFLIYPCFAVLKSRKSKVAKPRKRFILIPLGALLMTMAINVVAFGQANLATESGLTAHFAHNKYYYLSMPKFDMDYFLTRGGNMNAEKIIENSAKFTNISDKELRAALVSIIENPKSLVLNTLQKVDSYFFASQKTPQLSGFYFLSEDQKSIVIVNERLNWALIAGNVFYFLYRSSLLIAGLVAFTIYFILLRRRETILPHNLNYFIIPYLAGAVPGIIYYTESRFKVVSELLLVPLIIAVLDQYKKHPSPPTCEI